MKMRFKKLHPEAKVPAFAHATDAGMDLFTVEDFTIEPGQRLSVPTGIALAVPTGHVGLIWDKSGVSQKRGVKTLGGVIDEEYRGEIFVGVVNVGEEEQKFSEGDKIAQIIIQTVEHPELVEVQEFEQTARGEGRFGSTGGK